MSFLKFWGKKGKKEEEVVDTGTDPEMEKRRLRHSLSISRSGRFKQRKRERGQILDKPELFSGGDGQSAQDENQSVSSNSSQNSTTSTVRSSHTSHSSNTGTACRDINPKMSTGGRPMRMGQSVVT